MESQDDQSGLRERCWAFVRIALGMLQVMGATGAAVLLMTVGVNSLTVAATATAAVAVLVVTSRLLFRNERKEL